MLVGLIVSIHAPARARTDNTTRHYDSGIVSIHAPARARTGEGWTTVIYASVSIHAPARARTRSPMDNTRRTPCFNPRARAGANYESGAKIIFFVVSIHAPARARTSNVIPKGTRVLFQSKPP